MPYAYSPTKPADADLMRWAHVVTTADDPCAAATYIPLVRAVNERLIAAGRPMIPEDQIDPWFNASQGPVALYPADGLWQTLGGQPVISTQWLTPFVQWVTDGTTHHIEVSQPWQVMQKNVAAFVGHDGSGNAIVEGVPYTDTGLPVYVQPAPAAQDGTSALGSAWSPVAGDAYYQQAQLVGSGFSLTSVSFAYPARWQRYSVGYQQLQKILLMLLGDYVDTGFDPNGKTQQQLSDACAGSLTLLSAADSSWLANAFFGFFIPTLFQTRLNQWPARTAPAGWPGGAPFGGFTRKRERFITTLADPGVDGQLARFIVSNSGEHDDGPGGSALPLHPPTPDDQRKFSQRIMLRSGAAWAEASAGAEADIVTFYGPARAGDLVGPWIINELKDAINSLTTTLAFTEQRWPGFWFNTDTNVWEGATNYSAGTDLTTYGHPATWANALANYGTYPLPSYTTGTNFERGQRTPDGGVGVIAPGDAGCTGKVFTDGFEVESLSARLYLWQHGCPFARTVAFYYTTEITLFDPASDVFDAAGFSAGWSSYAGMDDTGAAVGAANGQVNKLCEVTSSADHVDASTPLGVDPPWLVGEPAPGPGGTGRRLCQLNALSATCNWDVTGGFKYSATPRGGV